MTENESNLIELTVARPDEALFNQSKSLMELAQNYEITSPEVAINAGDDLKAVKALAKQIEDKRTSITKPLNQALREVNDLFKPAKNWLKKAEGFLKGKMLLAVKPMKLATVTVSTFNNAARVRSTRNRSSGRASS